MALTRVTQTVINSNAVSAEKLANGSITSRTLANAAVELKHLAPDANAFASIDTVSSNVDTVQANLTANNIQNIANINTVSGNAASAISNTVSLQTDVGIISDNTIQNSANIDVVSTNATNITDDASTNFTVNKIFEQNVTVQGNLIVVGSQVDLGVGTATIDDNFVVVSANLTGIPATDSGLIINRGTEGNVFIGDHLGDEGIVFALTDSPHDNTTIAIKEYKEDHANAFHAESTMNFNRVHLGHVDDESTGIIVDTSNTQIKFIVSGTEVANIDAQANLALNDGRLTGNPNSAGDRNALDLDVDEESDVINSISFESVNSIFFLIDKNNNGDNPNAYIGVFNDVSDLSSQNRDTAIFSIRDNGEVFANTFSSENDSNIAGVGVMANDYATYTRLNANLNQVSSNVDAIAGGGTLLRHFNNVNTATGTSNVFFTGRNTTTDANVVTVSLDGIVQSNNEFVYHHSNNSIQFTDASIPNGTIVTIFTMT